MNFDLHSTVSANWIIKLLQQFLPISDKYRIYPWLPAIRNTNKKRTVLEAFNSKAPGTILKRCLLNFFLSFFFWTSPQDKQDYTNEGSDAWRGTISNLPAAR